jgi:leucine-rich repeat protein SHOC2
LDENKITNLPNKIGELIKLQVLIAHNNEITNLPESIGDLGNLMLLRLHNNKLSSLPHSLTGLINLRELSLSGNPLNDLTILQSLPSLSKVVFLNAILPRRYWTKFNDWKAEWLMDEDNVEIRRALIEQLGYEQICDELTAINIDTWCEYTLLKIDKVETIYEEHGYEPIGREPMLLLKMTCPSTGHIHILRVPPEMTSAEVAITWVNHGIHPDEFAVQT